MFRALAILLIAGTLAGCEPELKVGTWPCTSSSGPAGTMPDGSIVSIKDPVPMPWQNGFEDGFCGYARAKGFCYTDSKASYELVEAPVHWGLRAARFSLTADDMRGRGARCVREGALPPQAVYGAWFFLSSAATVGTNWNLMYFNGGNADGLPGPPNFGAEWDISIGDGDAGPLTLHLLNHFTGAILPDPMAPAPDAGTPPSVPVGEWFHVEFLLLRAQNATGGRVALYQNGAPIVDSGGIQTELAGATWGQWYVGNYADNLTPPDSTLYVDDVSIKPKVDDVSIAPQP